MAKKPDIFEYGNYRTYLADWMAWKKTTGPYSKRWFSRQAGFAAPNLLQLIVNGQRNLSAKSLPRFIACLSLTGREAGFFENMVWMNQSTSVAERKEYFNRMARNPGRRKSAPWEQAQLRLFENWLGPVLYELISFPDFSPHTEWIADKIRNQAGAREIQRILHDLVESGWVEKKSDGTLVRKSSLVDSGDSVNGLLFHAYHEQALSRAADALEEIASAERHFFVITSGAQDGVLPQLKALAEKFEAEILSLLEQDPQANGSVYQVSVQMFPVAASNAKRLEPAKKRKAP